MSNPAAKDLLVGLINSKNPDHVWLASQLEFATPEAVMGIGRNTTIEVSPASGQPYTGTVTLLYNRPHLSTAVGTASTDFELAGQVNTSDLVAAMAVRFGKLITDADIQPTALPPPDETGVITVEVTARPTSLLWTGHVEVTLTPPA